MKYMGSKARIAKEILPIILASRTSDQWYVEPFCGGCNTMDKVEGLRIAADTNKYLIALYKELQRNWVPPTLSKAEYSAIRKEPRSFPGYLTGWAAFGASYCGKYFGGYAGVVQTKDGPRDYQAEAKKNVLSQIKKLNDVRFVCSGYDGLSVPPNSIIYCDPPYEGTTGYANDFNHNAFWDWARKMGQEGHSVFVSEYSAPDDFDCVWSKAVKSSLSANGVCGGNKESVERLFKPRPTGEGGRV